MKRQILWVAGEEDNVGTALDMLSPGQTVPVISSSGLQLGELQLVTHVPKFFKASLVDLGVGDEVLKWGQPIARIADTFWTGGDGVVARGTALHSANFAPDPAWRHSLAEVIASFFQASRGKLTPKPGRHAFEIANSTRRLRAGAEIRFKDVGLDEVPPRCLAGASPDDVFGRALETVPEKHALHAGVLVEPDRAWFEPDLEKVRLIRDYYTYIRSRFYDAH